MKGQRTNSCRKLLKPVKHQAKTEPSHLLLILQPPQHRAGPAWSGGSGVPQDTAPCCGDASAGTGSQLWLAGSASKRNHLSAAPSGFTLCRCRSCAGLSGTSHTVLSGSKVEGGTAGRCLSLMLALPPSTEDLQAPYKPAVTYRG